jgi:hypothetical protein
MDKNGRRKRMERKVLIKYTHGPFKGREVYKEVTFAKQAVDAGIAQASSKEDFAGTVKEKTTRKQEKVVKKTKEEKAPVETK